MNRIQEKIQAFIQYLRTTMDFKHRHTSGEFSQSDSDKTAFGSLDERPINLKTKEMQRKRIIMVGGIGGLALILGIVLSQGKKPEKVTPDKKTTSVKESAFTSPVDNLDEQSVWIERAENKLADEQKNTGTLQTMVQKQAATVQAQNDVMTQQEQTIAALSAQIQTLSGKLDTIEQVQTQVSQSRAEQNTDPAQINNSSSLMTGMSVTTLALAPMPDSAPARIEKTVDNYVPSGSYVKAVMLGGLDASAGVSSQSNPRPVLLRTIDTGTLPNNFHSHLKNCRIIGAGYGDLSSERAYIRLESMSCMQDGKLVDFPVYGYISGPDGKDGIRGKVVMRDGELVGKAFIGGALSGFGDSVSDNYTETSISPLGSTTSVKNGENLEYGAAQGVSNAADLYAQYNIKRAEQLQPVIEVSAGTVVDVIFNKGFFLDGLDPKKTRTIDAPQPINRQGQFAVSQSNAGQFNTVQSSFGQSVNISSNNNNPSSLATQVQALSASNLTDSDLTPQEESAPANAPDNTANNSSATFHTTVQEFP